jgi:hypothetical protein
MCGSKFSILRFISHLEIVQQTEISLACLNTFWMQQVHLAAIEQQLGEHHLADADLARERNVNVQRQLREDSEREE